MDQYLLSRSGTGEPPHISPTLEHRARYADLVGEYVPILRVRFFALLFGLLCLLMANIRLGLAERS